MVRQNKDRVESAFGLLRLVLAALGAALLLVPDKASLLMAVCCLCSVCNACSQRPFHDGMVYCNTSDDDFAIHHSSLESINIPAFKFRAKISTSDCDVINTLGCVLQSLLLG